MWETKETLDGGLRIDRWWWVTVKAPSLRSACCRASGRLWRSFRACQGGPSSHLLCQSDASWLLDPASQMPVTTPTTRAANTHLPLKYIIHHLLVEFG